MSLLAWATSGVDPGAFGCIGGLQAKQPMRVVIAAFMGVAYVDFDGLIWIERHCRISVRFFGTATKDDDTGAAVVYVKGSREFVLP